jgi:hypothetical protein
MRFGKQKTLLNLRQTDIISVQFTLPAPINVTGLDSLSDLSEAIDSVPHTSSTTVHQLIREQWIPFLDDRQHTERSTHDTKYELFSNCKSYLNRWKHPRQYLENHKGGKG